MGAFADMVQTFWDDNRLAINNEIEDRTGQRPSADNPVAARIVSTTYEDLEIDHAVLIFNGEAVGFITVDWGEPLLKICYV